MAVLRMCVNEAVDRDGDVDGDVVMCVWRGGGREESFTSGRFG